MKWLFPILLLLAACTAPAATPLRPQYTVQTMAELAQLDPRSVSSSNRVAVAVLGRDAAGDAAGHRMFFWDRTNATAISVTNAAHYTTNAAAIGRWVSVDRNAPIQNAAWWGAKGDGTTDDTVALNACADYTATYTAENDDLAYLGQGFGEMLIPPTRLGYLVSNSIYIQSSCLAGGASIIYRGPTDGACLIVGPKDWENTLINFHRFHLPSVWGRNTGFNEDSTGVIIRSVGRSDVYLNYVYRFGLGFDLVGDYKATTLNSIFSGFVDTCRQGIRLLATNDGFVNGNTFNGLRINGENLNFAPGADTGYEFVSIDGTGGSINGNAFYGGSWEGFPSQRVIDIVNASATIFDGIRFEHHAPDYTNVVASQLRMRVAATQVGKGLDNRVVRPSQGVNGMNGLIVEETGYAAGNSGASSQWQEFRTRDTGTQHGPIVLTPSSPTSQGLAHISVYPYMGWPTNHSANYDRWVQIITGNGMQLKEAGDAAAKLYILTDGEIIQSAGTAYLPQWKQQEGVSYYYDTLNRNTMRLNRAGNIQWLNPTNGASLGYIRAYHEGFFGGLVYSEPSSNTLGGLTLSQNLDSGSKAWAGIDIVGTNDADTNGVSDSYVELAFGTFSTTHPYGPVQGGAGIYMSGSTGSVARSHFSIALVNTGTVFQVINGITNVPSLKVDGSTTPGHTRLWIWDAATGTPTRVMHDATSRLFHSGSGIHATLADLVNITFSAGDSIYYDGSDLVRFPIGSVGQIGIATNGPARTVWVTPGTATWRDVPGSGNASTSQVVLGSDTRLSDARTPTAHTHPASEISDSTSAGRALLTAVNAAAQRTALGLGTIATIDDAPSDGNHYGRSNGVWAIILDGGGGGSYSNFWADFTNTIRAGANVSIALDPTNRTATWSATSSGGSTSGTPVSINAGGTLAALNLQSGSKVSISVSGGSNGIPDIIADSLTTNDITAGTEAHFLNRGAHTGTQTLSTISDAGTAASRNVPPSGDAATNQVVLGNDTRLTNARTPSAHTHPASEISDSTSAGRTLLTAANAAAQRTALGLGTLALIDDAPSDGKTYGRKDGGWSEVTNSGSGGGGSTTISNLMQRVGWAEFETVLDWRSSPATGIVQNASQGGTLTATYTPSTTTNGVAGMPPFPDNPFGARAMRVNIAGSGITSNTVFVLKKLSLQTTNVASSSYTNSGWSSADYLILHGGLVSTNIPLLLDVDPGFSTIALGTGLDLHTWTNRFRLDIFDVTNVSVSAGSGSTNLVSTSTNGLAPQISSPDSVLQTDSTTNLSWGSRWMPVVTISGTNHTLALTNAGQYLRLTSASACAITVPAGTNVAYTLGTEIVVRVAAAGIPTLAGQGGVTLNGTNVVSSLSQHSTFGLKLVESTSTNWVWDVL